MPSHYTDHGCPSSVLPFSFQHVSSAQQRSHQNNMMFDVDMPSCSGNQAGNVNQPSLSSHAEIGVIKRTGDLLVKKMDAQNGEGPSCSSSKLQTPNPATTSTSALSSILAASTKRTSPTVPQSRTELYSGLSTPVKSSSSVQPDSPPKVEENKNNNDKNNESSEDSSGHSPMNSSFSGTSPSSSSLQGSGSGVTMCSSEEAALHGSSSPPSSDPLRLLNTYVTLDNGHLPRSTRHDSENTPLNLSSSSSKSESRRAGRLRSDDHLDYQRVELFLFEKRN